MWLPRLWFIGLLLIATAAVTGAKVTPDLSAERARLAENITLQLKQHALELSAELSSLAGDPQLTSLMNPERLWATPALRAEALSERRDTLLGKGGAQLTQDLMLLDPKLSQVCQGARCRYEPLLRWSSKLSVQESVEGLKLKALRLTERLAPPRWAWVGPSKQLVVATSVSQKTTFGLAFGLGPSAEQLYEKELQRSELSPEHFALFLGETKLTGAEVAPPKTNAPQALVVRSLPAPRTWESFIDQVKGGFLSFKEDPIPLVFVLVLGLIGLLLDMRKSSTRAAPSEEEFSYDWDLPPSENLHTAEPEERAVEVSPPLNPTSDLPLSTRPDEVSFAEDVYEDSEPPAEAQPAEAPSAQNPSVPPIIHGEAATPLNAISTDEFEPADVPELDEGALHLEPKEALSQEDEDAFDELFDELSDPPLEGDSFVQELGSFLEGELGDLLGAQGQTHLAALDEVAWSQAPVEQAPPEPIDPSEYEDFEKGISDELGEVFADELSDPDDFFKHIGLVSELDGELASEVELIHSIAPSQLKPQQAPAHDAPPEEQGDEEEDGFVDFDQLGLGLDDESPSLDEVEVVQSTQPAVVPAELQDGISDFEGSLDLEDDFPDVLEEGASDQFHPDLDLTPLPSEEDFRQTPERESMLGELLHGVASIPPADERPTTLAPLAKELPEDDVSAELMGQEEELIQSGDWALPSAPDDAMRPVPTEAALLNERLAAEATFNSLDELPVSLDDSFESADRSGSLDHSQDPVDGFISQWEEGEDDEPVHYQELQEAEELALNPTPHALPLVETLNELSLSSVDTSFDGGEGELWAQEAVVAGLTSSGEDELNAHQREALDAFMALDQDDEDDFGDDFEDDFEGEADYSPEPIEPLESEPLASPSDDFAHDPGSMVEGGELAQVSDLMSLMESEPAPHSESAEEMGFFDDPIGGVDPLEEEPLAAEPFEEEPLAAEPFEEEPLAAEPTSSTELKEAELIERAPEELGEQLEEVASVASLAPSDDLSVVASLPPQAIPAVDTLPEVSVAPTRERKPIDWAAKARERRQARLDHYREIYHVYCELKQSHEPEARLPAFKDFIDQLNDARQKYIDKHGCLDVRFEAKLNKKGRVSIKPRAHTPS